MSRREIAAGRRTMTYTLDVLLVLAPNESTDALDEPLADEAARLRTHLAGSGQQRVVHNLRHHRREAVAAGNALTRFDDLVESGLVPNATRVPINSFDAVLEISVPIETGPDVLIEAVDGLAGRLGSRFDPTRSAAALGVDHPITDGGGALQIFVCLRRMPGTTHDEFCDYWRNDLVQHTTKTPGKTGYRQLHADPALTSLAARATGVEIDDVDGVALEFYPDVAGLYAATDWASQPGSAMIRSESQMIDFTRGGMVGYASRP
jgi:hypothetical protein